MAVSRTVSRPATISARVLTMLARRTPPLRLSYIGFMIEMQYNFPLLPTQGKQWQQRLAAAVAALSPEDFDELRPTYRQQRADHRAIAAQWLHSDPANTFITCAGHHGTLVSLLAARFRSSRLLRLDLHWRVLPISRTVLAVHRDIFDG